MKSEIVYDNNTQKAIKFYLLMFQKCNVFDYLSFLKSIPKNHFIEGDLLLSALLYFTFWSWDWSNITWVLFRFPSKKQESEN